MTRTMTLLLISLGVLLAFVTAESEAYQCKEDEEYSQCYGHCPATCDNPEPICPLVCIPGCVCKRGTVKNSFGKCVAKDKC